LGGEQLGVQTQVPPGLLAEQVPLGQQVPEQQAPGLPQQTPDWHSPPLVQEAPEPPSLWHWLAPLQKALGTQSSGPSQVVRQAVAPHT